MIKFLTNPKHFTGVVLIAIWFSLDIYVPNVLHNFAETFSLVNLFNIVRLVVPYITFVIFVLFFYKKLNFKTGSFKLNLILTVLILNFLVQLITSYVYQDISINNANLIMLSCMSLILFMFDFNFSNSKKTLILSWFVLFTIFSWFSLVMFQWYFSPENPTANLYGGWPSSFLTIPGLTENIPRSSGIGRSSLILAIPIMLYLVIAKRINLIFYFIYNYCFFILIMTQSRIVLFGFFLISFVVTYYVFALKLKTIEKIKKIILIFLVPIVITFGMIAIKTALLIQFENKKNSSQNLSYDYSFIKNKNILIRTVDHTNFTSNRFKDWKLILKKNNNVLFGNGAMGDRLIIGQSASNLILYNYSSSGIIGVLLFAIFLFRSFFVCSKILLFDEKKISYNNYILLGACYIQYFLMGRSLVETSFAVFGIDFLIFFAAYFFTEEYYNKKKIKKII